MTEKPLVSRGVVLRDFIWTLIRTDFKTRYHGAIGGFIWALLKPVVMFAVLLTVFTFIFTDDPKYMYNLLIGILLWSFFAEGTSVGLESLHRKGFLLTKAAFPPWVVVVTSVVNALMTLLVYVAGILVVVCVARGVPSVAHIALFFIYVVTYVVIVVGFSLGASVLFLKYRDLNQIWDVILQAGFFVAPIMYPLSKLPERYHFWLYIWPVTPILQFTREVLVDGTTPSLRAHGMLAGVTAVIVTAGVIIFRRYHRSAIESL
jgi:lipopolysaccharide transport system permease protein